MDHSNEMLSFLDSLDLDEELVDSRLRSIMDRSNYSNIHLTNALQLLQYKHLINLQDETECENTNELEFTVKLIKNIHPDIIENVCKIIISVLQLKASAMVRNSEHLLHQILPNIDLTPDKPKPDEDDHRPLLNFKVCDSVLDAVISLGLKIDLTFMDVPLEKVICHPNERVKVHFITSTIPKIFKGIVGFNILDRVWNYIKKLKDIDVALKVLSCLSEYYLPAVDLKGKLCYESEIVYFFEFWRITLLGLISSDFICRKISVYLAKRAIDYLASKNKNVNIESGGDIIFSWYINNNVKLRKQWDNFFILIDSLEEKQSNIVLPSLKLFEALNEIPNCWVSCAFNLGLKHDNSQVRLKCIEHRLKRNVNNVTEAIVLIQALDDMNFYETTHETKILKEKFTKMLMNKESLINILQAIPESNLSPVPLFQIIDVLAEINLQDSLTLNKAQSEIITELIKVHCNIIPLRKAIHINIALFVCKSCKQLDWEVIAKVFSILHGDKESNDNPHNLISILENRLINNREEVIQFLKSFTNILADIDFGLFYLDKHLEEMHLFIEIMKCKVQTVRNIVDRQYSNKLECLHDALILSKIINKCEKEKSTAKYTINKILMEETKIILIKYVLCLLSSDVVCTVDESKYLLNCLNCINYAVDEESKKISIQLYKSSVMLLKESNTELEKAALCIFTINSLTANKAFVSKFKHEMLSVKDFLDLLEKFEKRDDQKAQSVGRLKNIFYEKHSETVNCILEDEGLKIDRYLNNLVDYLDNVIERGGYGCLYWILKIMNKIIPLLTDTKGVKFNINQFIKRTWREIEELKTDNKNYSPSIEEFINLLTHEALLEKPELNNIVILYCIKIIEYGLIKNSPLYYLAKELKRKDIKRHGHLVLVLSELLLYSPVSRKDQRITDNLAVEIIRNPKYAINIDDMDVHFNFEIQFMTISILTRINDSEIFAIISSFITNRIDNIFKHKVRYHGNSQLHREIQTGLQHLLFILLLNRDGDLKRILNWCVYLLGKLPHQQSVRVCLEWYITLCFYIENRPVNNLMLDYLKSKNVPVLSQFMIMYWLVKHKIAKNRISCDEYEFVLDTLLSNTMGQLFYVRLNAQYLSTKLYGMKNKTGKYDYTIEVINKALTENATDKNFMKLKEDYFVHKFDLIGNLTPYFLYHLLPILCDSNNGEIDDTAAVSHIVKEISINIINNDDAFVKEWASFCVTQEELDNIVLNKHADRKSVAEFDKIGTLQKKYIPWKNMSDVNAYETTKKRETTSKLIVVASLIDKLPNLGGMARTSEVFGVQTYVIDSLRHLQDKQFQGLSVSAERWIDVEEIRPGQPLKDYLNKKKAEGYAVVAAEQTSTGSKLQSFKFPKKTLLLLGHEKEGIPCDLLPMMDHCVEIPQQGFVRSLNVHVTAAIFVWEYSRQNLL